MKRCFAVCLYRCSLPVFVLVCCFCCFNFFVSAGMVTGQHLLDIFSQPCLQDSCLVFCLVTEGVGGVDLCRFLENSLTLFGILLVVPVGV